MAGLYPPLVVQMFSFRLDGSFFLLFALLIYLQSALCTSSQPHFCCIWKGASLQRLRERCGDLCTTGSRWCERALGGLCSPVPKAVHAVVLGFVSSRITGVFPSVSDTAAWVTGRWKRWSCIPNLLLPYYLFDLARVSQSFEANDRHPLPPSWDSGCLATRRTRVRSCWNCSFSSRTAANYQLLGVM